MNARMALMMLLVATPLAAQQPPQPGPGPNRMGQPGMQPGMEQQGPDPFARYLFPPEMIMQHQGEIGLKDAQRDQIRAELQKAQATFTDVQWRMAPEGEKLEKLLQAPIVDEARVLAQVDAILALEREIKRTHIGLLVRIRNLLTDEQRTRLMQMKGGD